jgi:hypothetical protein
MARPLQPGGTLFHDGMIEMRIATVPLKQVKPLHVALFVASMLYLIALAAP